jgi:hypothetical protein
MDTKGHEECAALGGEQIQAAVSQVPYAQLRLGAFYLGNWLTDVSQTVDPVAVSLMRLGLRDLMYRLILEVEAWSASLPDITQLQLNQLRNGLNQTRCGIDEAIATLAGTADASPLASAARSTFFALGYRKFVHPNSPKEPARMHYASFRSIVNSCYTQYFPHEHVDRYPEDPKACGGYTGSVAPGTNTPTGKGTGASSLSPHQYQYLVDDIKIIAGLLAEIDLRWARKTFSHRHAVSDTNVEWNTYLARLGHAIHAVEDYFVHSNYLEHALHGWPGGAAYLPEEPGMLDGIVIETSWEIVKKRLYRFDGKGLPNRSPEPNVVTGYFDSTDTLFSLRHVWEEVFGGEGGGGDAAEAWRKLLHHVVVTIHEKTRLQRSVTREQAIRIARETLLETASKGDPDVREAATDLVERCPSEVRDEFLNAAAQFCVRAPDSAISLYTALERIHQFIEQLAKPTEWVRKMLGIAVGGVVEFLTRPATNRLRQIIDNHLGRTRVGSHSLLAKDYAWEDEGREDLDRIYNLAKGLAKAIHWYVIHALTRWGRVEPINAARTFAGDAGIYNTLDTRHYIDWLELLECFLRHPHAQPAPPGEPWWQRVVENGYHQMQALMTMVGKNPPPHQYRFVTEAEVETLIADAKALRTQAETRYNSDPAVAEARAMAATCQPAGAIR